MAHTLEELESLLEGRALIGRVLHEEPGADHEITDVRYFRLTRIVTLKLATGDCTFTLKDVEALLDGQKVEGMGKRWNKTYTLLPAEEEPGKPDAEPTEAIVFGEPGDGGEAINEYFRRERAKGRSEADITKDFLEGPEIVIENGEYRWVDGAEMEANVQWLQAATEFFAKEPERTYTTAELVSKLGMLRSAVATTREQSKPAKPRLSAKWEERWWDVYLRYYIKGAPNAHNPEAAAQAADKAVDIARKHLEGE